MFDEEYTFSKSEISILKELAKGKQRHFLRCRNLSVEKLREMSLLGRC